MFSKNNKSLHPRSDDKTSSTRSFLRLPQAKEITLTQTRPINPDHARDQNNLLQQQRRYQPDQLGHQQRYNPASRIPLNDLPVRTSSSTHSNPRKESATSRTYTNVPTTSYANRHPVHDIGKMPHPSYNNGESSRVTSGRQSGPYGGSIKVPSVKSSNARLESSTFTDARLREESKHDQVRYRGIHHLPQGGKAITRDDNVRKGDNGNRRKSELPIPPTSAPAHVRLAFHDQQQQTLPQPAQQYPYERPRTSQGFSTSSFRSKIPVIVSHPPELSSTNFKHHDNGGSGRDPVPPIRALREVKSSRRTSTGSGRYAPNAGAPSIASGNTSIHSNGSKPYYQPLARAQNQAAPEVANPRPGGAMKISEMMERRISRLEDALEVQEDGEDEPVRGQEVGGERAGRASGVGVRTIQHPALEGFAYQEPIIPPPSTGAYTSRGHVHHDAPFQNLVDLRGIGSIKGKIQTTTKSMGSSGVSSAIPVPAKAAGKTRKSLAGAFGHHSKPTPAVHEARENKENIKLSSHLSGQGLAHHNLPQDRFAPVEYIKPSDEAPIMKKRSMMSFKSSQTLAINRDSEDVEATPRISTTVGRANRTLRSGKSIEIVNRMEDAFAQSGSAKPVTSHVQSGRKGPGSTKGLLPAFQLDGGAPMQSRGVNGGLSVLNNGAEDWERQMASRLDHDYGQGDDLATPKATNSRFPRRKKSSPLLSRMRSAFHLPSGHSAKLDRSAVPRSETPTSLYDRAGTPTSIAPIKADAHNNGKSSSSMHRLRSRLQDWSHGSSDHGHTTTATSAPRMSEDSVATSANTSLDWSFASVSTTDLHAMLELQEQERLAPLMEQDGARGMNKKKSFGAGSMLGRLLSGKGKNPQGCEPAKHARSASPSQARYPSSPERAPPSEADSLSPMSTPRTTFTASSYSPLAPDNDAFRIHHDSLAIAMDEVIKLPQLPALHFSRPSHSGSLGLDLQGNGFVSRFGYGLETVGEDAESASRIGSAANQYRKSLPLPMPSERLDATARPGSMGDLLSRAPRAKTSSTRPFAGDWEDFSVDEIERNLDAPSRSASGPQVSSTDITAASSGPIDKTASKRDSGKLPQRRSVQATFGIPGNSLCGSNGDQQNRSSNASSANEVSALIPEEAVESDRLRHKPSLVDIAKMDRANENLQFLLAGIGATPSTVTEGMTQDTSPESSAVSSSDLTNESPTPMRTAVPSHLGRRNMQPTVISPLRISPLRLAISNSHSVRSAPASSPAGKVFAGRGSVSSTSRRAAKARSRAQLPREKGSQDDVVHNTAIQRTASLSQRSQYEDSVTDDAEEVLSDSEGTDAVVQRSTDAQRRSPQASSMPAKARKVSLLQEGDPPQGKISSRSALTDEEDGGRTSFDFAGELAALAGGSRESFLEELENYGLGDSSAESMFVPAVDKGVKQRESAPEDQARKFQPKSLFYGFNQNFRFGDSKPQEAPHHNASGRHQQDPSTISFASMSSLGREITTALRRDKDNVFDSEFGGSVSLPPVPSHLRKPSGFSSFGNADTRWTSSTPIGSDKAEKAPTQGRSGRPPRHRPQQSSGDSRHQALSVGRSGVDSDKMFDTNRSQTRLEAIAASPCAEGHIVADKSSSGPIKDSSAGNAATSGSVFQTRLRQAPSDRQEGLDIDDRDEAENLAGNESEISGNGESSVADFFISRPRPTSRSGSGSSINRVKPPRSRKPSNRISQLTWDTIPPLEHTANSDSERYSTDVQSILSTTVHGQSGTWTTGRAGGASHFVEAARSVANQKYAESGSAGKYEPKGHKLDTEGEELGTWMDLQRRWDAELTRSTQAYVSSAETLATLEPGFIPPVTAQGIQDFVYSSTEMYQTLSESSPRKQIWLREHAQSFQAEREEEAADDSDGDAVSTIHTAESCTFHPAKKLSLPLPTKFQRADSDRSIKGSLGAALRTSTDDDGMTPELAAMMAKFTANSGSTRRPSTEVAPNEPSSAHGVQTVVPAQPCDTNAIEARQRREAIDALATQDYQASLAAASTRRRVGDRGNGVPSASDKPSVTKSTKLVKSPRLEKQASARRLAEEKENVGAIARLHRRKTRSARDLARGAGGQTQAVVPGMRFC